MTPSIPRALRLRLASVLFLAAFSTAPAATVPHPSSTIHVANNGIDAPLCGLPQTLPCRSITQAVKNAGNGDHIVVGPGIYGDLSDDGTIGQTGEEAGAPGCGCVLAINKGVIVTSTDGAASTVINAHNVDVIQNVLVIGNGAEFGRPSQGFTVTNTREQSIANSGIVIDATNVKIRGNQVISVFTTVTVLNPLTQQPERLPVRGSVGIGVVNSTETILIEANQVIGWSTGIHVEGAGKMVIGNQVSLNDTGILADGDNNIAGNGVIANEFGMILDGLVEASGNALIGNEGPGVEIDTTNNVVVQKNNIFGNDAQDLTGTGRACGVVYDGATTLLASHNFWGSSNGPGPHPGDNVCNLNSGTIISTPFAAKPFVVNAPIRP